MSTVQEQGKGMVDKAVNAMKGVGTAFAGLVQGTKNEAEKVEKKVGDTMTMNNNRLSGGGGCHGSRGHTRKHTRKHRRKTMHKRNKRGGGDCHCAGPAHTGGRKRRRHTRTHRRKRHHKGGASGCGTLPTAQKQGGGKRRMSRKRRQSKKKSKRCY